MSDAPKLSTGKKLGFMFAIILTLQGIVEIAWHFRATAAYQELLKEQAQGYFLDHPIVGVLHKPGDWSFAVDADLGKTGDTMRFHINSRNLRSPEILDPRPAGSIRILCLGGSTTFGTGCKSDSLTYPALLQRWLSRRDPSTVYEVLNAGVPGFRSAESYHSLLRLADLKPEIIVVFDGINDLCWGEIEPFFLEPDKHPRSESRSARYKREAESFLFQVLIHKIMHPDTKNSRGRTALDPAIVDAFGRTIGLIVSEARSRGIQPVYATFDVRMRPDFSPELRAAIEQEKAFRLARITWQGLYDGLAALNVRNRQVCQELGVPVIEIEYKLPVDGKYWMDFVHLNEAGTPFMVDLIGEGLVPVIEEIKKKRQSP